MLRPALVEAAAQALDELEQESTSGPALVVTLPWREGGCLHNAVALVAEGRRHLRFKHELPNYGVFDEKRVFSSGPARTTGRRSVTCELVCQFAKTFGSQKSSAHLAKPRRGTAPGPEWLPVRGRETAPAAVTGPGARQRDESSARLCESGRRPGRARVRRRFVRRQRRRHARASVAALAGHRRADAMETRKRRASMRGHRGLERTAATRARSTTR